MAGRTSNRDRIEHLRAEADATAKEKAAKRAEKAAKPAAPRKSTRKSATPTPVGRVRFVWSVCGPNGKEVEQFPYAQEQEARARAAALTTEVGRTHFVTKAEVKV